MLLPANVFSAQSVNAEQWEITADKLTKYEDPPSVIAEGNVILEKKEKVTRPQEPASSRWDQLLGESEEKKTKPKKKHRRKLNPRSKVRVKSMMIL